MKKVKVDGMILATFLTTLFYASTFPFIHKQLMMEVSDNMIALANIIDCVSVIIFGSIWNKWSDKLFPFYPHFCIAETVVTIGIAVWVLTSGHLAAYYMLRNRKIIPNHRYVIFRNNGSSYNLHYVSGNNVTQALPGFVFEIGDRDPSML